LKLKRHWLSRCEETGGGEKKRNKEIKVAGDVKRKREKRKEKKKEKV